MNVPPQPRPLPRVLLVEDQPLTLVGMKMSLQGLNRYDVVGEATDGIKAIEECRRLQPDVVLMDVSLPEMDGIEASQHIKAELPSTRIVMFTSHNSPDVVAAALGVGAEAYCLKARSVEQVAVAIDTILSGNVWIDPAVAESVVRGQGQMQIASSDSNQIKLSKIELEAMKLIRDGLDNKNIASKLQTSEDVVSAIMRGIIHAYSDVGQKTAFRPFESNPATPLTNVEEAPPPPGFDRPYNEVGRTRPTPETVAQQEANQSQDASPPRLDTESTRPMKSLADSTPVVGGIFADKYRMESVLGYGGTATIWKAQHVYMMRHVAIKVLHPNIVADHKAVRRFQEEAAAIACLSHDHVVGVYDFGLTSSGQPFLVMECVEGTTLDQVIKLQTRLNLTLFKQLFMQICDALEAAHAAGLVHCDLKPSNCLIFETTKLADHVKLADFGIAKMLFRDSREEAKAGQVFVSGTPSYMSPEQWSGKKLDQRSDIYSLGCVMFEALTGQKAFSGTSATDISIKHFYNPPPLIGRVVPEAHFPPELEYCVAKMLQKEQADRFSSVKEVADIISKLPE